MLAYLAIQCRAPGSDKTGTFLYTGAASLRDPAARLVSPIGDTVSTFAWARANGWAEGPRDAAHPVGVYVKGGA